MTATDPEARESMRARIVETLGEHAYRGLGTSPGVAQLCTCGFMSYKAGMDHPHTQDQHRAHLADVLLGLWDGDES